MGEKVVVAGIGVSISGIVAFFVVVVWTIPCANQPPHASVSGLVDTGSVCSRDYAGTDTSLACIHGAEEPNINKYII